ncbi:MAG: ribosome silencing factor [Endomicrobium sp.]|nr:ribosome silencing factor [Endomicrobium sp.]
MSKIDFYALAITAAKITKDKKAVGTVVLDVRKLTAIADYFVVTTGQSTPQINAISDDIEKAFKEQNVKPLRRDGARSSVWRVLDYGGIIVHIMSSEIRESYKFEELWNNAKIIEEKNWEIKAKKQTKTKKLVVQKTKKRTNSLKKQRPKQSKELFPKSKT